MTRKRTNQKGKKTLIIEAATRCFLRKGYENTTIDDIAAEYGRSKGSIYWYYPSKKAILVDFFYNWMEETYKGIEEVVLRKKTAREKIVQANVSFIEYLLKDFDHYRPLMVLWSAAYEDETLKEKMLELYKHYEEMFIEFLKEGEKNGEFSVTYKYTASAFLVAFVDGILIRQILVGDLDLMQIKEGLEVIIDRLLPPFFYRLPV